MPRVPWLRQPPELDLVLVVAPQNRGWILDAFAREIAQRHTGSHAIHYDGPLPAAKAYLFTHYSLFLRARREKAVRRAASIVWFTHPSYTEPNIGRHLNQAAAIVTGATAMTQPLLDWGVDERRTTVILPGADPDRFTGHARGSGAVGFCMAYYERKRPELVAELVAALPHRRFRLLGRGWKDTSVFDEVRDAPNFEYREDGYDAYPAFYAGIDVFVSPARLEGGPVPLLESMMANAVPVASDTGMARDLITPGVNGFICPVDAPAGAFAAAIEDAYQLEGDVRATVQHYTWDRFAHSVLQVVDQATK